MMAWGVESKKMGLQRRIMLKKQLKLSKLERLLMCLRANLSGQPSSVDIKDFENLREHCACIYDGGVLPSGRAGSTVVDLTELGKYKILRPGSAKEEPIAILETHTLLEDGSAA